MDALARLSTLEGGEFLLAQPRAELLVVARALRVAVVVDLDIAPRGYTEGRA